MNWKTFMLYGWMRGVKKETAINFLIYLIIPKNKKVYTILKIYKIKTEYGEKKKKEKEK